MAEKLKILDFLKSGEKLANIARKYSVDESTIRLIMQNKKTIWDSATKMGSHVKFFKIFRKSDLEAMEDMLIVWLQDPIMTHSLLFKHDCEIALGPYKE